MRIRLSSVGCPHLVIEFYIREKPRPICSAIYSAAVKPRPNRRNDLRATDHPGGLRVGGSNPLAPTNEFRVFEALNLSRAAKRYNIGSRSLEPGLGLFNG